MQDIYQIFPRPVDRFFFKVIAERPVAQHLEHGVMVGVESHLFEVVVLAADTQTFLRVGDATVFGGRISQDNIFELVHPRIGKHQCGVVFNHHRCRRHDLVSFRLKECFERFANLLSGQHILMI